MHGMRSEGDAAAPHNSYLFPGQHAPRVAIGNAIGHFKMTEHQHLGVDGKPLQQAGPGSVVVRAAPRQSPLAQVLKQKIKVVTSLAPVPYSRKSLLGKSATLNHQA